MNTEAIPGPDGALIGSTQGVPTIIINRQYDPQSARLEELVDVLYRLIVDAPGEASEVTAATQSSSPKDDLRFSRN
jgi:hypothetical protein